MASIAALDDDDEETVAEVDPATLPRKRFSGRRIVMIAVAVIGLAAAGGAYTMLGHKTAESGPAKPAPQTPSIFFDLPDILVNLDSTGKQPRFLKLSASLELGDQKDVETIKKLMPRVLDQFQTYLRGLRVEDLRGSAGVYRLRQELLARISAAAEPTQVRDVLFRELLIQ